MKLYASNATGAARDQGKYLTGTRKLKIHQLKHISGWWFQPTPLKNMTSWVGMMKFPNIWNKKMFRKQISCDSDTSGNSVGKVCFFFFFFFSQVCCWVFFGWGHEVSGQPRPLVQAFPRGKTKKHTARTWFSAASFLPIFVSQQS